MKKNEDSLRNFWDNIKPPIFALEESQKEKKKEHEKMFKEIIAGNFPNMGNETFI